MTENLRNEANSECMDAINIRTKIPILTKRSQNREV